MACHSFRLQRPESADLILSGDLLGSAWPLLLLFLTTLLLRLVIILNTIKYADIITTMPISIVGNH